MSEPRTISYAGGPWSGKSVTIPGHLVVDRRDVDDHGGAYVLDGDTYTWQPTPSPAKQQPAGDDPDAEHLRPAPEQDAQVRPAEKPAAKTRPAPTRKPASSRKTDSS